MLRQYLEEIGYKATIIDVRSQRVHSILGLQNRGDNDPLNSCVGGANLVNGDASGRGGGPPASQTVKRGNDAQSVGRGQPVGQAKAVSRMELLVVATMGLNQVYIVCCRSFTMIFCLPLIISANFPSHLPPSLLLLLFLFTFAFFPTFYQPTHLHLGLFHFTFDTFAFLLPPFPHPCPLPFIPASFPSPLPCFLNPYLFPLTPASFTSPVSFS